MNRKLTVALLAVLLLLTMNACGKKKEAAETTVPIAETAAPTVEETTEPEGFANEAIAGEPAPFDSENAETIPAAESDGNAGTSNKKPSSGSNTGSSNKKPSSGSNTGTSNNKPSSGSNTGTSETLPPEVDVSIGVVEGSGSTDFNEDDSNISKPTEPQKPTNPPEPTEPHKPTQPVSSLPEDFSFTSLTYESYNAMTGEQQAEVIEMFSSPEVFVRWYKAAEAQYKAEHPDIEIGSDGSVNAGDLKG